MEKKPDCSVFKNSSNCVIRLVTFKMYNIHFFIARYNFYVMKFHQLSREHHAIEFDSSICFESNILIRLHESHTFNTPFPQKKRKETFLLFHETFDYQMFRRDLHTYLFDSSDHYSLLHMCTSTHFLDLDRLNHAYMDYCYIHRYL